MEKYADFAKRILLESSMNEARARDFSKYMKGGKLKEVDLDTNADELYLYINNSENLYRRMIEPINKNLLKKKANGNYDSALAPQAFYNAVEQGAKDYKKECGNEYKFSTADKEAVAVKMAYEFEDENGIN